MEPIYRNQRRAVDVIKASTGLISEDKKQSIPVKWESKYSTTAGYHISAYYSGSPMSAIHHWSL
jgi:hypothetical protein